MTILSPNVATTADLCPETRFAGERCLLIGTSCALIRLQRQLALLGDGAPQVIGALACDLSPATERELAAVGLPALGVINDLEAMIEYHAPTMAVICLPAVMSELILATRTKLRRLGVADRFIPTLEDQLQGVGPRMAIEIDVLDLIDRQPVAIDEDAIDRTIRGRRVLITGAGGSIGSELARIAARYEPKELLLMERSENALFEIDRQIARKHPHLPRGAWLHDVTDADKTLAYCVATKPQVIFHAAAHKHVPMMEDHPALAVQNNFFGTKAIADAAAQTGCDRFVMISTDKAVNPSSVMGATKRLAELYVQHLNEVRDTTFEIVRFGNVLGSAGSVLTIWSDQIREGGPITVTHPEMTRYFMTIPEAAALVVQAAALDELRGGDIAVLDMGEPIEILGLAKRFIELHGLDWVIPTGPNRPTESQGIVPIVFTGIRPGEKLHEELVYERESMVRSPHEGIRIWKSAAPSEELVGDMVATLIEACERGDAELIITSILRLIPEMQLATKDRRRARQSAPHAVSVKAASDTANRTYRTGTTNKGTRSKVA